MTLRQREPRDHDRRHLDFVRALPCCVCGKAAPSEAAHLRMGCIEIGKRPTGMGEKPSDAWVNPLCSYHHRTGILAQHKISEREFWFEIHSINPFETAARLWIESGGAARALEPKRSPLVRQSKPRDHSKPKRKIPGRALQSKPTFPLGRKLQSRNSFERREAN